MYLTEDTTTGDEDGMVTQARTYDTVGPFHGETDSLKAYVEHAHIYFNANEVAEDKHAAVFPNELGERAYAILRDPVAPDLPRANSLLRSLLLWKVTVIPNQL